MKRVLVFLMLIFTVDGTAQGNLVPNPGFEYDTACPNAAGQIHFAVPWVMHNSSDLFDSCGMSNYDTPSNIAGWQNAHTGGAYCGLGTFTYSTSLNQNYREFLQVRLLSTLVESKRYCIQFYVSLANVSRYYSPNIGVLFSDSLITPITWTGVKWIINYSAQVENPVSNSLNDTMNWVLVSGEYVAEGGENYITIGNFKTDSNTTYQDLFRPGSFCYLYIDDVSLVEKIAINAGANTTICPGDSVQIGSPPISGITYHWNPTAGISDTTAAQPWVKPGNTTTYQLTAQDTGNLYCLGAIQPVTITVEECVLPELIIPTYLEGNEVFRIQYLPPNSALELYDMRGRLVLKDLNYQNDFSVANLAAGIYSYQLQLQEGTALGGKICIGK